MRQHFEEDAEQDHYTQTPITDLIYLFADKDSPVMQLRAISHRFNQLRIDLPDTHTHKETCKILMLNDDSQ